MTDLQGTVKFAYGDNRHQAREYLQKDLNALFRCDEFNKKGVNVTKDWAIVDDKAYEPDKPHRKYYAEVELRIVQADVGPKEMKEAIENSLQDLDNVASVFIFPTS